MALYPFCQVFRSRDPCTSFRKGPDMQSPLAAAMVQGWVLSGDAKFSTLGGVDPSKCRIVELTPPTRADDAFAAMFGWLAVQAPPERIPPMRGPEDSAPQENALKALCAPDAAPSAPTTLKGVGTLPRHRPAARSGRAPAFPPRWVDIGAASPAPSSQAHPPHRHAHPHSATLRTPS